MSKRKKRRMLLERSRYINWDVVDLREAKHYFWIGDYAKAGKLLYALSARLIIEPHKDTKEYKDGERKPDTPFEEQEQEKVLEETIDLYDLFTGEINPDAPEPERDESGYLIR